MEQSWLDTDGTASGTGERTIIASQYANDWWRLDPDCRNLGSHFLTCSAAGGRSVGGLKVQWDPARDLMTSENKGRDGSAQVGPVPLSTCGEVQHAEAFPKRPDQPVCHYYMRTGTCKFGAACRFHHPVPPSSGYSIPLTFEQLI